MITLKSLEVLSLKGRNSSVDIFRSLAIISVVVFHFNHFLPFGQLGVDLFFVISGLLVGGLLTKDFRRGEKINFLKFFLQRGFKIWPSFYTFLIIGNIALFYLYKDIAPDQYIPLWDIKRYLFFYQNYTGIPFHWSFDHVWSLCVEEHFYILLPLGFILIQKARGNQKLLFLTVGLVIIAGITFKALALYYTNSKDTYSATHNRIDALGWGVLLNLIINFYPQYLEDKVRNIKLLVTGIALLALIIIVAIYTNSTFYHKVVVHSIVPFAFSLMLFGAYKIDLSNFKTLRFIAYYSYNWYLWHPLFVFGVSHYLGANLIGLSLYLTISFIAAMFFTIVVEEPVLGKRNLIINKFFPKTVRVQTLDAELVEQKSRA